MKNIKSGSITKIEIDNDILYYDYNNLESKKFLMNYETEKGFIQFHFCLKGDISFDKKPSAKKPVKPKKEEAMPTITRSTKKEPGEVMQSMKEEIASSMAQDRHPLAAALSGGEWVTPDLIKEMAKRPVLAKGMSNPKYQAALQELQKDPKNGAKKFDSDPELKRSSYISM